MKRTLPVVTAAPPVVRVTVAVNVTPAPTFCGEVRFVVTAVPVAILFIVYAAVPVLVAYVAVPS
jgi:hypothetical protein